MGTVSIVASMEDEFKFDSFDAMLEKFKSMGYRVERVVDGGAIVFNEGQEPDYSMFDNLIATVAVENGFNFRTPDNMKELHEKTVRGGEHASNYEIYLGVFTGDDPTILDGCGYEFRND